jgi:oxygen-independent coproporphyrinogen-3 oxidase
MSARSSRSSPGGIYIHVPFCRRKCLYCSFYSVSDLTLKSSYVAALLDEIRRIAPLPFSFDTVYFGGGTPSLLDPKEIRAVLEELGSRFSIRPGPEITLEINPGTVEAGRLNEYRSAGANRLSIGVQSFNDRHLKTLGRMHTAKQAEAAVASAMEAGFDNIGLDLIFCIPGQTKASFKEDLKKALSFKPDHLSCYQLTVEKGTPFEKEIASGRIAMPGEKASADLLETAFDYLTARGFLHYEISNYAVSEEKISRHNSKYWSFAPYIGLGPSAHSYLPPKRRWNHADIDRYLEDIRDGKQPTAGEEILTVRQQMLEAIFLGLRTSAGIDIEGFEQMFGIVFSETFRVPIETLSSDGFLVFTGNRCRLTRKGLLLQESVVRYLADSF